MMFRSMRSVLILTAALFCLSIWGWGCAGPPSMIDAAAIQAPLEGVLERHDRYVNSDAALSATEKSTYLRSSAIIKDIETAALMRGRADQVRGR
jgi:hypothetical protein